MVCTVAGARFASLLETEMTMAALPDHNRLTDPLWRLLFHNYRHLITALRHNGWTTDVQTCGSESRIVADLNDGTELVIHCGGSLPAIAAEVTGWVMVRQGQPDTQTITALYDSTPDGPQAHHGTGLVPLLSCLDALGLAAPKARTSTTFVPSNGALQQTNGPIETIGTAVARYFEWGHQLVIAHGYRQVWERPEEDGHPLAVLENVGHIAALSVSPWHE
jgi:hypothetical protein